MQSPEDVTKRPRRGLLSLVMAAFFASMAVFSFTMAFEYDAYSPAGKGSVAVGLLFTKNAALRLALYWLSHHIAAPSNRST